MAPIRRCLEACTPRTSLLVLAATLLVAPLAVDAYGESDPFLVVGETHWMQWDQEIHGRVVVPAGSTLVIEDSRLELHEVPCNAYVMGVPVCGPSFVVHGTLHVINSTLIGFSGAPHGAGGYLIEATKAHVRLTDTALENVKVRNDWTGATTPLFADVFSVHGATATGHASGLEFIRLPSFAVTGSTFYGVKSPIFAKDSTGAITDNLIAHGGPLSLHRTILGDKMQLPTQYTVVDNRLHNNSEGVVHVGNAPSSIAGNTFQDNQVGLALTVGVSPEVFASQDLPSVTGNRFARNDVAVSGWGQGTPSAGANVTLRLDHNTILPSNCKLLDLHPQSVLVSWDARWNWWGSDDGPTDRGACTAFTGDVQYKPWLDHDPTGPSGSQ